MAQVKVFSMGGLGAVCCCGGGTPTACTVSSCNVPAVNLTMSWTDTPNSVAGAGSTTLTYFSVTHNGFLPPTWQGSNISWSNILFDCSAGGTISYFNNTCQLFPPTTHPCPPFLFTFVKNPAAPSTCNISGNGFTITLTP